MLVRKENKIIRKKTIESSNSDFDNFVRRLMYSLRTTFKDKGWWFLSKVRDGNTIVKHENGVSFILYDEVTNNKSDVVVVVAYPNGKSNWVGSYWKDEDLIDIADKMYELAVVRYRK